MCRSIVCAFQEMHFLQGFPYQLLSLASSESNAHHEFAVHNHAVCLQASPLHL